MADADLVRIATNLAGDLRTTEGVGLTPTIRNTILMRLGKLRSELAGTDTVPVSNSSTTPFSAAAGSTDSEVTDRDQGVFLIEQAAEGVDDLLASCSIGEVPESVLLKAAIAGLERAAALLAEGRPITASTIGSNSSVNLKTVVLNIEDAARYIGVNENTIRRWIAKGGRLWCERQSGGLYRFNVHELDTQKVAKIHESG